MAHAICYLIDLPGTYFNSLLDVSHRAPTEYVEKLQKSNEADFWDGLLPGNKTCFLSDLSGQWTLCKLPYSYYAWQQGPRTSEITAWERLLRELVPSKTIIRVSDSLLDPWNAKYDYLLPRRREGVAQFVDWLESQDRQYWTKLATIVSDEPDNVKLT